MIQIEQITGEQAKALCQMITTELPEYFGLAAKEHVGIGVGLYGGSDGGFGQAQRLYIKRGYIPDGLGVTYDYKSVVPGKMVCLDDDLILWFTKKVK